MNRFWLVPATVSVALFSLTIACGGGAEPQEAENGRTTAADVAESVEEAAETLGEYAADTKEEFVTLIQAKLAQIDRGIDDMEASASEAGEAAEEAVTETLERLREKRQAIQQDLQQLPSESEAAWEEMRAGIARAVAELDKAYQDALAEFD